MTMRMEWKLQRPKGSDAPSWEYHVEHFLTDTRIEEEVLRDRSFEEACWATLRDPTAAYTAHTSAK